MNIVKNIEQYDENNVYFFEPIKNNIMNDGTFIRILYSTENIMLNGIYLHITLNDIYSEKYYNKYRCMFNTITHKDMIESLKVIEDNILKKTEIKNKIPQLKINEQLKNGNIKLFCEIANKTCCSFILKISGIWETQTNYGLTYKFIKINN
jgi:hypothetical protein